MKTLYQYIHFEEEFSRLSARVTRVFDCRSNSSSDILGRVKWYGAWRQYCFFPAPQSLFNNGCLADIQDFIRQLMEERKPQTKENTNG